MDWQPKLLFTSFLILAAAINGARANAVVTGTVFCDQCKEGQRSLFAYPINGIKVAVACTDSEGNIKMWREETTNWFGNYAVKFDGNPDLSGCYAQISGGGQGSTRCGAASGPAQNLRLMSRMFDMEIYSVDSLISQPAQPMSFCPSSSNPVTPIRTPTVRLPPMPRVPPLAPLPPWPPVTPITTPPVRLPPTPKLPPLSPLPHLPPVPFLEASACSHENWTRPEHKCYWRAVNPDTKVAVAFGLLASRRYGTDITLWGGLQGRGDPYRTLLREGITALLNSYNSIQFPYHTIGVIQHMNWALMGSRQNVLHTALRFKRANSGSTNIACKFTPCK